MLNINLSQTVMAHAKEKMIDIESRKICANFDNLLQYKLLNQKYFCTDCSMGKMELFFPVFTWISVDAVLCNVFCFFWTEKAFIVRKSIV